MADHGFKYATWNYMYHKAGKHKDGVEAALKRSVNFQVLHGNDIPNASDFVHHKIFQNDHSQNSSWNFENTDHYH